MNSDRSPTDGEYYAYRLGVALLILLTVTIVAAQVWAGWSGAKQVDSLQHDNLLIIGDLSAKYAIASSRSTDNRDAAAVMANNFYSNVPPSPATYRRMGLLTQVMWGISGLEWIKKIDSSEVTRGLGRDVVKKLRTEKQLGATTKLQTLILDKAIPENLYPVIISGARTDEIIIGDKFDIIAKEA